ncbi:MAG: hypothetical protein GWO87_01790 [Xanthomonadaceae bacterium]|nr:hypothetical protein [Rhodospirillaceae bacterium]NIA17902.1 hypothetical protein [Xanthomonadaceae bacterium]
MKSYIKYKDQIEGFKDVSETVKTVEKIAASSIHFLKQETFNLNVYASEIEKVLAWLSIFYQKKDHPLLKKRNNGNKELIIVTGNKGLDGGLWHKIITTFIEKRKQYQSIIVIGVKGKNYLDEELIHITKSFAGLSDIPQKEETEYITNYIFNEFKQKKLLKIDILYPHFVSLAEQEAKLSSLLPFEFETTEEKNKDGLPIFEPSKKKIFNNLLQKYVELFFYKIMMETKLSEFSARTVAMEHANTKIDDFIQKSTLDYTKQRRRIITQRQLESFAGHKTI